MADASLISPSFPRSWSVDLRAILLILLATLPWWIAVTCPFIALDDQAYIAGNAHIAHGFTAQSIAWAFSSQHNLWIPLTWLSLMLDAALFGLHAAGFHFTNVILHILNTCLLYFVLRRMTRMPWRSLTVALLFSVHPLRVESVAWATERKDVLAVFFGLLALWAYWRYARRGGTGRYLSVLALFLLSLMAKPMLVTLPFLLVLLDLWPLGRARRGAWRKIILEKLPLLAIAVGISAIAYVIQVHTDAEVYEALKPLSQRLANVPVSYMFYLRDTFYFGGLAIYYPWNSTPAALWIPSLCVLVAGTAALVAAAWRKPSWRPILIGWLWFLGTLIPAIGLVQSGNQSRADRFTYFPSIGVFIAIVWAWPARWAAPKRPARITAALAAAAVVLLAVCMTLQLWLWRDPLTLYRSTLERTRDNWFVASFAAEEYQRRGEYAPAIAWYQQVVRLAPYMHEPENNLGGLLVKTGRLDEALPHFARAHALDPANPMYEANYQRLRDYLRSRPPPHTRPRSQ